MKKQESYVLLPTYGASRICLRKDKNKFEVGLNMTSQNSNLITHHLYVLSDDEIKEGDWFVEDDRVVHQANSGCKYDKEIHSKIIATTNPELHNKKNPNHNENSYVSDVPSISLPDVVHIISLHNDKTKHSNSIMVEYENVNSGWQQLANDGKRGSTIVLDNLVPKLDKQGNITIIRD